MRLTFLGTGTSKGVPEIGCTCPVCQSADKRDRRLRVSVLIETDDARILIDCGPDFREQMLRVPFGPIEVGHQSIRLQRIGQYPQLSIGGRECLQ